MNLRDRKRKQQKEADENFMIFLTILVMMLIVVVMFLGVTDHATKTGPNCPADSYKPADYLGFCYSE